MFYTKRGSLCLLRVPTSYKGLSSSVQSESDENSNQRYFLDCSCNSQPHKSPSFASFYGILLNVFVSFRATFYGSHFRFYDGKLRAILKTAGTLPLFYWLFTTLNSIILVYVYFSRICTSTVYIYLSENAM